MQFVLQQPVGRDLFIGMEVFWHSGALQIGLLLLLLLLLLLADLLLAGAVRQWTAALDRQCLQWDLNIQ